MNIKYFALVLFCLVTTTIFSQEVGDSMKRALFDANFEAVKERINLGMESVHSTASLMPLIAHMIPKYCDFKNDPKVLQYRPHLKSRGPKNLTEDSKKIIIFLISKGAPINQKTSSGLGPLLSSQTALHLAIQHNLPEIVEILLDHGADTTIKNKDGLTAYELAVEKGNQKIKEAFGHHNMRRDFTKVIASKQGQDAFYSFK